MGDYCHDVVVPVVVPVVVLFETHVVAKDYLLWQMKIRVSLQYLLRCRPEQSQVVVACVELESIVDVELDEDVE